MRIAYMVFHHSEFYGVSPTLHEANDTAKYLRERDGRASVILHKVSLKDLQEILEREISDDEWEQYSREEKHDDGPSQTL